MQRYDERLYEHLAKKMQGAQMPNQCVLPQGHICPICEAELIEIKCKLVCSRCNYFQSCTELE